MSFAAQKWAIPLDCGSGVTKCVLLALAYYADDEGLCWPSQETIAQHIGFSSRAVRNAIADLRGLKLITSEKRRRADGSRTSDTIVLKIGAEPQRQEVPVAGQQQAGGATQAARGAKPAARGAGHEPSLNHQENNHSSAGERDREGEVRIEPPVEIEIVAGAGVVETVEGFRPAAPVQPLRDVRQLLDTEGVSLIQEMTGRTEIMARKLVAHFLRMVYGEANVVLAYLREAKSRDERDPSMWVEDQLRARTLKSRTPLPLPGSPRRELPMSSDTANLLRLAEKFRTEQSPGDAFHAAGSGSDDDLIIVEVDDEDGGGEPGGGRGEDRDVPWQAGSTSRPSDALLRAAGQGGVDHRAAAALRRQRTPRA